MSITTPPDTTPAASHTPIFKVYDDLERYMMLHFYSYDNESAFDNASTGIEKYLSTIQLPIPTNLIDNQQIIMSETEIGPLQEYLRTADLTTLARSSAGGLGLAGIGLGLMGGSVAPFVAALTATAAIENTIFANGGSSVSNLPPEYDLLGLGNILRGGAPAVNEQGVNTLTNLGQAAAASFARNFSQRLTGVTQNVGQIINPVLTPIFNNVQLKRHNFVWKIAPETPDESRRLKLICKRLQYHALPQKERINLTQLVPLNTLTYPDYCRVELNPDVYSFKKNCFIENVIINHAPEGVNSFYKDGTPVVTEISVFLLETNIYTKDDFDADEINLKESEPDEAEEVQTVSPTEIPPVEGS